MLRCAVICFRLRHRRCSMFPSDRTPSRVRSFTSQTTCALLYLSGGVTRHNQTAQRLILLACRHDHYLARTRAVGTIFGMHGASKCVKVVCVMFNPHSNRRSHSVLCGLHRPPRALPPRLGHRLLTVWPVSCRWRLPWTRYRMPVSGAHQLGPARVPTRPGHRQQDSYADISSAPMSRRAMPP